ncbi:hypothetical protein BDC45DRAFT_271824 [Circinella umbellata]|nr:hypothetical protein BDC45DRAFT_271824 [Circinella umbellata]
MSALSREPKVILAPLSLYRHILRVHRCMPAAMRAMGDDYVKSEFRRHKDIDNPVQIMGFLSQWQDYLVTLEEQTAPKMDIKDSIANDPFVRSFNVPEGGWGKKLDEQRWDKLSDEQIGQLYELKNELEKSLGEKMNNKKN